MKEIVKPIAVLAAICLVVTALLAYINSVTAPIIADADAKAEAKAVQEVLADGQDFETVYKKGADDNKLTAALPAEVTTVYKANNGAGYVFRLETKGYGGTISLMCGIKADGSIESTQTLTHSETSGIGSKVVDNESGYRERYVGKTAADYDGVDAVTGATISSKAYKKAVKAAFEAFEAATKEAQP